MPLGVPGQARIHSRKPLARAPASRLAMVRSTPGDGTKRRLGVVIAPSGAASIAPDPPGERPCTMPFRRPMMGPHVDYFASLNSP